MPDTGSSGAELVGELEGGLASSPCNLQAQVYLNRMYKAGDFVLGGLFNIHLHAVDPELSFTSRTQEPNCFDFSVKGFRQAQIMSFAIAEINRNSILLPNVTLGYSLYDNCLMLGIGLNGAMSLVSGREKHFLPEDSCVGSPPVLGIVGDSTSTSSVAVSRILGLHRMPLVSYGATCTCLSERSQFPSFFRTVPSDAFQVRAMLHLMRRFEWTWIGLLFTDGDSGLDAAQSFQADLEQSGFGCLAYVEALPWDHNDAEVERIVTVMKESTARVVVAFVHDHYMHDLLDEVIKQNVTGLQWMAGDGWTTNYEIQTPEFMPYLQGILGVDIRRGEIPGLKDFLLKIHPENDLDNSPDNTIVKQFWEHTFQCKFAPLPSGWVDAGGEVCTGQEDLEAAGTTLLDMSNTQYTVYKAVYALAHALHDTLQCVPGRGPFSGDNCASLNTIQPWQVCY